MGDCGWLLRPALMTRAHCDIHWRYVHNEELIGRVHGGLWLASSACPYDSSILRLLANGFLYAESEDPLERDAR